MKNLKITILLAVGICTFSLLACSDDSSTNPSSQEEKSESSQVVESSESQESNSSVDSKSSDSVVRVKTSSSTAPKSSAQKGDSSSSSAPKSSSSVLPESSAEEEPPAREKDWRDSCLDIINEYRATENLEPLSRASDEKQACTDKQAADDLASESPHGHFGDCGEGAQNTGPDVRMYESQSYTDYAQMYLKMMWEDEKALVTSGAVDPNSKVDYPKVGHYLNMKNNYKTVACGFAVSSDGKKGWLNINFFR